MMPICRIGDSNNMGGVCIGDNPQGSATSVAASTVFASFRPVAKIGFTMSPHAPWDQNSHPPHEAAVISSGAATVFADFRPVAMVGSMNSCGHSMNQGDPTVIVT